MERPGRVKAAMQMAEWCIHTGQSRQDYLDMTGYERNAFIEVANKYRKRKGGLGTL
jgi:hypothetical protein